MLLKTVLLLSLAAAPVAASAQTVYRCGNSYGSQPCAGGTAIDVTDRSTPADASRAGKLAEKDMKRAEAMEKERLAQEKNAPRALVIGPKEAPAPVAAPKDKKKEKAVDPNVFTAAGPKKAQKH